MADGAGSMDAKGEGCQCPDVKFAVEIYHRERAGGFAGREPEPESIRRVEASGSRVENVVNRPMGRLADEMPEEGPPGCGCLAQELGPEGEPAVQARDLEPVHQFLGGNVANGRGSEVVPGAEKFADVVLKGNPVILDDQAIWSLESGVQALDAIGRHGRDVTGTKFRFDLQLDDIPVCAGKRVKGIRVAIRDNDSWQKTESPPTVTNCKFDEIEI